MDKCRDDEYNQKATINYKIFLANNENSNQYYQNSPSDYPYKSEEELNCYRNCLE